jgi:hypothetical protein
MSILERVHNIGVKKCWECCTDYRIDFKHYYGHRWALFFTKWKNSGARRDSEVWRQHILPRSAFRVWAQTSVGLQTQIEDQPQDEDLSSAFGDSDPFKFDSEYPIHSGASKSFRISSGATSFRCISIQRWVVDMLETKMNDAL